MWLTLAIVVATSLVLLAAWVTWSLLRSAASDSSSVTEEYDEYVNQKAERSATESPGEQHPNKHLT